MVKKIDPRSPAKKVKDAAYVKQGVALILRPLKVIRSRHPDLQLTDFNGKVTGYEASSRYLEAWHAAKRGDGLTVSRMAATC